VKTRHCECAHERCHNVPRLGDVLCLVCRGLGCKTRSEADWKGKKR
jgi:uncharacterized membrane protein